jgi:hypothetical protein
MGGGSRRTASPRWQDVGYHLDRDVMIESCAALDGDALAILRALPSGKMDRARGRA